MTSPSGWLRSHTRAAIFGALVLLQVVVVLGFIAREEIFLRSGTEILVESAPVDPRDPLRGDFIILAYAFERPSDRLSGSPWCCGVGDSAYVWLRQEGEYWEPFQISREQPARDERPDGAVILRGRVDAASGSDLRLTFTNINQVFVPQGEGEPDEPPDVILVVNGDGSARVKGLQIRGQPFP